MTGNTTSTSILIPTTPPTAPAYDEWSAYKLVFGGIVAAVIGVNAILSMIKAIVEVFEKRKAADKERNSPTEHRVEQLEKVSASFRSVEYLDKEFTRLDDKIAHHKNNQSLINDQFSSAIKTTQNEIGDLKLNAALLRGKVEILESNNGRLESKVDLMRDRIEERFDRLTEHLSPKPFKE